MKQKNFSAVPAIEYLQYQKIDSTHNGVTTHIELDIIISFKDGDGDIGIVAGDNTSPPDLKLVYQHDSSGVWLPYNQPPLVRNTFDTLIINERVPYLTPQGQYKDLQGQIRIKLPYPYSAPIHPVFRYAITLKDRAGHLSNMVYTDAITTPQ